MAIAEIERKSDRRFLDARDTLLRAYEHLATRLAEDVHDYPDAFSDDPVYDPSAPSMDEYVGRLNQLDTLIIHLEKADARFSPAPARAPGKQQVKFFRSALKGESATEAFLDWHAKHPKVTVHCLTAVGDEILLALYREAG